MATQIQGAWLTVNRYCNFRCLWCYATGTMFKPEDNMSLDEAKKLADLICSLGVKNAILIGGETFFWPHVFELATYLKSLGMGSTVVTNGWILGKEKFRDRVAQSDITAIGISIKAGNRQQYIDLTGFDGMDSVLEGIRETSGWKHIFVEASTVISTKTIGNITEIVKLAFDNGIGRLALQMCGPMIGEKMDSTFMPKPADVVDAIMESYGEIDYQSGGNFVIEQSLPTCIWPSDFLEMLVRKHQVYHGCHMRARIGLLFDRWGQVIACNHLYDYPMGKFGVDFTDAASFKAWWENPKLLSFYDKILSYPATRCVTCETFNECGGGCPLQWIVRKPDDVIPMKGAKNGRLIEVSEFAK